MKPLDVLIADLQALPAPPTDRGRVERLVVRPARGTRETPDAVHLSVQSGVAGDRWQTRAARYGARYADRQVTLIRADVARVLTEPKDAQWTGDNLHLDIDLSVDNLPVGSQMQVGEALIELSAKPHTGCKRFRDRFGDDAARVNAHPLFTGQRIRGALGRIVRDGQVRIGDPVVVIRRGLDEGAKP